MIDRLMIFCSACGNILDIRVPIWHHTKKRKGFAYIEFEKDDEACAAVERSGIEVRAHMRSFSSSVLSHVLLHQVNTNTMTLNDCGCS